MKQFLFFTILCAMFATATKAQIPAITVTNNTNCDVYYVLRGETTGSGCTGAYASTMFVLVPGGTVFYSDAGIVPGGMNCASCTPPTLAPGDDFSFADIYQNLASCGGTYVTSVGDPCSGYAVSAPYNVDDAACTACGTGTVTWDSATQTLTFN